MTYTYKLTEEISRWAFEIHIKQNKNWWIAFTNPTAGPWKRVEALDQSSQKGEVCRFDRDEKRPDIVIVNDKLQAIIIFEAKDSLEKLTNESQVFKSCKVINDMAKKLSEIKGNKYWGNRYQYKILNGILWGSMEASKAQFIDSAFARYSNGLNEIKSAVDSTIQIGIESTKGDDGFISLIIHTNASGAAAESIITTLK